MTTWGHDVWPLTDQEREQRVRQEWPCSIGRCDQMPTHETAYRYVTGRQGRTTFAAKKVCADHAAKFAAKPGLEIPAGRPDNRPVHALDAVLRNDAAQNVPARATGSLDTGGSTRTETG